MFSVELSTREWDGHVVVALGGERHPPERSAVAHGSRPERQERHLPHSRTAEPMTVNVGPALPSAARNMARGDPATVVLFPGCGDDR